MFPCIFQYQQRQRQRRQRFVPRINVDIQVKPAIRMNISMALLVRIAMTTVRPVMALALINAFNVLRDTLTMGLIVSNVKMTVSFVKTPQPVIAVKLENTSISMEAVKEVALALLRIMLSLGSARSEIAFPLVLLDNLCFLILLVLLPHVLLLWYRGLQAESLFVIFPVIKPKGYIYIGTALAYLHVRMLQESQAMGLFVKLVVLSVIIYIRMGYARELVQEHIVQVR